MDCSFRSLKQNPCYTVTQSVFVFPVCVTFALYQNDNLSVNPLHNPTPADTGPLHMQSLLWRDARVMVPAQHTAVRCQSLAQGLAS